MSAIRADTAQALGSDSRHAAILAAVADTGERLLRSDAWSDALPGVLELVGRAAEVSRAFIFESRYDAAGGARSRMTAEWVDDGVPPTIGIPFWQDYLEPPEHLEPLQRGEVVFFSTTSAPPDERSVLAAEGTISGVSVPILVGGRLWGYIGLDDCDCERVWTAVETEALRAASGTLAAAIERAEAHARIDVRERILAAVASSAESVLKATSLESAIDALLAEIGPAAGASRAHVFRLGQDDHGAPSASLIHEWVAPGVSSSLDWPVWQQVPVDPGHLETYARGEPFQTFAKDVGEPERGVLEAEGTRSYVEMPIHIRDGLWGWVGLDDCTAERSWALPELDALRAAAGTLGAAIERRAADEALRASDERLWQARKMEAVGRLAGGVAHDLNNYLTAIVGYAEFVREQLPAEARADVHELLAATDRVGELVKRLLVFSRPSGASGSMALDAGDVIQRIEGIVRALAGDGVDVQIDVAPRLESVIVDRDQLERVIVNLAVNARDAMPRGGTLSIATRPEAGGVALEVSDTGVGMDEATRARALEPFFTTKGPRGTGLGLATVYGIVNRHGGRLELESAPGSGTRVTVWLPAA